MAPKPAFGWLGPLSGIAFAVLVFVAYAVMGDGPQADPEDPAAKIAAELEQARDGSSAALGILGLALFFFVFFLSHLRDRFRHVGDEGAWLVSVLWAAGLLLAATYLLYVFVQVAQVSIEDYGQDTQVAKALFAMSWNSIQVMGPPLAAFGAAAAILILRFKLMPRWLGVLAVIVFLSGLAPWIGFPLFALWVLLTSIVLLVEGRKGSMAASP